MFEGKERIITTFDWVTILFIVSLFLIALARVAFPERFKKLLTLFYSEKYYSDYSVSKPVNFNLFHGFLFPVFLFNISLLIFLLFQSFGRVDIDFGFRFYLQILAMLTVLILLRLIIGVILSVILELYDAERYLTLMKTSNLILTGLYLLPLMILIIYTPLSMRVFLISAVSILLVVFLLFRYFSLMRNDRLNFNTLFYLILYLCALEIAPFIIVYKLFVK